MSLKILFDPIYSGHLDRCSTAFKYRSIVEHNLAQGREDWFYYWVIPPRDTLTEEELAWLPQAPQIRYLEVVNLEDRMREYMRFTRDLDFIYGFNGDYWDWDVVVTVRTSQIANMRAVMSSPRQVTIGRKLKKVICLEEMLIIDRKKTVAKSDIPAQELLTVAGYLCADLTLVAGKADLDDMNHTARKYLAPSQVMEMNKRIVTALQATIAEPQRKAKKFMFQLGKRPLCVMFAGRMEKVSSNLEDIYGVMQNQFVMNGDQGVKLLICTVSKAVIEPPPDVVEVRRPPREEFWRISREEADVMLILFWNAEMGLSMIEPMLLGVPAVIIDQKWTRDIWGPNYPFYATNAIEAYAIVKAFRDDYAKMYARFWDYVEKEFLPRFQTGDLSRTYYEVMHDFLAAHEQYLCGEELRNMLQTRDEGAVFKPMAEVAEQMDSLILFDFIRLLKEQGKLDFLHEKTKDGDRDRRRIVFATPWNEFRILLKAFHGFADASTEVGHLRKLA